MNQEALEIINRIRSLMDMALICVKTNHNYETKGNVKYWFQYKNYNNGFHWLTPAQMSPEQKTQTIEKLQKMLDVCDNPNFYNYIYYRYIDMVDFNNNDEFNDFRKIMHETVYSDDIRLIATYSNKVSQMFDYLEHKEGLQAELNGKVVNTDCHWELFCDFKYNSIKPFIEHFWRFHNKPRMYCCYNVRDKHDNYMIDVKRRYVKDVTRFGKSVYGKKTIAELKKISLVGDKNVWGTYRMGMYFAELTGDATYIWGDISHLEGKIHPDLIGDVSNLSGNITNLIGNVNGVKLFVNGPFNEPTDIKTLMGGPAIVDKFHLISNEDNKTLMRVWNCLAHHTIGVTSEERKLFDNPKKCKPPFPIDKWGRCYMQVPSNKDRLLVFSINPADIMFAKDVNNCSTCFCLNSGNSKWELGMRCLIALNSVNPNLGVAFTIKQDSVKKMNQFNNIKFKWYEPENAGFFQYNSQGIKPFYNYDNVFHGCTIKMLDNGYDDIKPIYGHDGYNDGHSRQKKLAYLETFIKDGYRWYRGEDKSFPLVNNEKDFTKEQATENGWDDDIKIAQQKEQDLYEYMKRIKGE